MATNPSEYTKFNKEFARRLTAARKENGLSIRAFANKYGIQHSVVVRLENGTFERSNGWPVYLIAVVADLEGLKLSEFLKGFERDGELSQGEQLSRMLAASLTKNEVERLLELNHSIDNKALSRILKVVLYFCETTPPSRLLRAIRELIIDNLRLTSDTKETSFLRSALRFFAKLEIRLATQKAPRKARKKPSQ